MKGARKMTKHMSIIKQFVGNREATGENSDVFRYARCIAVSKRVRWTVEDVIQGRTFDTEHNFLPDGFAKAAEFPSLSSEEIRFISQIQGRTYANMFGLLERYVNAKVLELSRDHWFGDQTKLEALVRFSDEEIKHQHLFRCIEDLIASVMPDGYCFTQQPNQVAKMVLGKSTWAVLGLTLMVELVTQAHYRESIDKDANVSPLYKDVFRHHWMEECQHAILDELEWRREDRKLTARERDMAVDELIELATAIDGILQDQAAADAMYFQKAVKRPISQRETEVIAMGFLKAYRWQYILSGAENAHFARVIEELTTDKQMQRVDAALQTFI
jgi:hypothetical protein